MKTFKTIVFSIGVFYILSCQKNDSIRTEILEFEIPKETLVTVPKNYELYLKDEFTFFNTENWSKGLTHSSDASIKMIWNKNTGGSHLLNDQYAGYIKDKNTYIKNNILFLDNIKEKVEGDDPKRSFDYTTGWINSLQKINFNGTEKGIYLQIKAKFPKGDKVWPAIWLIDDSDNRSWPPEVDIWEYFGKYFKVDSYDNMYMRFIYGKWNDKNDHSTPIKNFHQVYNASEEWHTYGYQWTQNEMRWIIDGVLVHTKTKGIDVPESDWPNKKMCLVINNGLLSPVPEGDTSFPNSLLLDSLELYQEK